MMTAIDPYMMDFTPVIMTYMIQCLLIEPHIVVLIHCHQFDGMYHQYFRKMPPYSVYIIYDDRVVNTVFDSHSVLELMIIRPQASHNQRLASHSPAGLLNLSLLWLSWPFIKSQTAANQHWDINDSKTLSRSLASSIFSSLLTDG